MGNPNKYNSFTLRGKFIDRSSGDDVDIVFSSAADTILNNPATVGKVTLFVALAGDDTSFQTTFDGQSTFQLNGTTYCMNQAQNGPYVYFPLGGGLPDGYYTYWMEYVKTVGGVYHPRLSTAKKEFTVDKENVSFT